MEYMLASQLDPQATGTYLPAYEVLKKKPAVTIDEQLRLVSTPENKALFAASIADGSRVVKIRRESHEALPSNFPKRVLIELTTRCNLLCCMCPRNTMTRRAQDLDRETCFRLLDEANLHGTDGIWLYHLGESLLHKDFAAILNHAGSLENIGKLWLSSNGLLLNDDNISLLLDSKLSFLNVSLLAGSPAVYKSVAGRDEYLTLCDNVKRLLKRRTKQLPILRVQMIEQEQALDDIPSYLETWLGVADIVSVNQLEHLEVEANQVVGSKRVRPPRGHCRRVARGDCIVCSNGAVVACDAAYNGTPDSVGKLYLGNIHTHSLYDIWNSAARAELVAMEQRGDMAILPLCSQCNDYDF